MPFDFCHRSCACVWGFMKSAQLSLSFSRLSCADNSRGMPPLQISGHLLSKGGLKRSSCASVACEKTFVKGWTFDSCGCTISVKSIKFRKIVVLSVVNTQAQTSDFSPHYTAIRLYLA